MPAARILIIGRGDSDALPSYAIPLIAAGCQVDVMRVPYRTPLRGIPFIMKARISFSQYDLIVAAEYALTWSLAVRLARRVGPKLIALGFNQSARLFSTGIRPIDLLLNRIWQRVDLFIVHSKDEIRLFGDVHGIAPAKFAFVHWGYDLPARKGADRPDRPYPFVSMIGRNNRDIKSFCTAVVLAGVRGVLVTSADLISDQGMPDIDAVEVLVDIPADECLDIVAQSDAHLVLLCDGDRGAGHISAVSAMLLGKPQIFSDVPTLSDYLIDGLNGLGVPLGDAHATADAIIRLSEDPGLGKRLGAAGKALAREKMSDDASTTAIAALILENL